MTTTQASPTEEQQKSMRKRFIGSIKPAELSNAEFRWLSVAGAVAVIVGWMLLTATGFAADAITGITTYPATAGLVIGLLNVVLMAYPVYKGVRRQDWLRVGLAGGTVVLALLATPYAFRLLAGAGIAQALWGLVIPGVMALILNAILAARLATYETPNTALVAAEEALKEAQAQRNEARRRDSQVADEVAAAEPTVAAAEEAEKRAKEAVQTAETKEEEAKATVDKSQLKVAVTDAQESVTTLSGFKSALEARLRQTHEPATQQELQNTTTQLASAESDLSLKRQRLKVSAEHQAWKRAKRKAESAKADFKDAQAALKTAQAIKAAAVGQRSLTEGTLLKKEADVQSADQALQVARQVSTKDTRGWLFWTVVLAASTGILYSSWYGWVIAERF